MVNTLGYDGELERYSRGLDSWVPLDSDASFGAMRRSIDVQRKASDGNNRARVLLRIKPAKPGVQAPRPPALPTMGLLNPAPPMPPPKPLADGDVMMPQPFAPLKVNERGLLSIMPFARESGSGCDQQTGQSQPQPPQQPTQPQPQQQQAMPPPPQAPPQPQPPQIGSMMHGGPPGMFFHPIATGPSG